MGQWHMHQRNDHLFLFSFNLQDSRRFLFSSGEGNESGGGCCVLTPSWRETNVELYHCDNSDLINQNFFKKLVTKLISRYSEDKQAFVSAAGVSD